MGGSHLTIPLAIKQHLCKDNTDYKDECVLSLAADDEGAEKAPKCDLWNGELLRGTATFLSTDIEGSTKLAQQYTHSITALLDQHHAIRSQTIRAHWPLTASNASAVARSCRELDWMGFFWRSSLLWHTRVLRSGELHRGCGVWWRGLFMTLIVRPTKQGFPPYLIRRFPS